ncbi:MAG: di-trans,poly-cis-decaprenylcistransferase, partial [Bifidobacteriaceae bacterium]|nr:di-trans,poly-cis-decaprenylcistransferase [Bifidobacteriaceae bacterium]
MNWDEIVLDRCRHLGGGRCLAPGPGAEANAAARLEAMAIPGAVYRLYERRLKKALAGAAVPRHVGVILDGNRRWAKEAGESTATGHRAGADKIIDLLTWSEEVGVELVTLWMLSTDNLDRAPAELMPLLRIIEQAVAKLARSGRWRIRVVGALDLLPYQTAGRLHEAEAATAGVEGLGVNVAIGYGGRREIADAVRSLLAEQSRAGVSIEQLAHTLDVEHIAEHLYTRGQPDPELVIRTSGEQRLSGF